MPSATVRSSRWWAQAPTARRRGSRSRSAGPSSTAARRPPSSRVTLRRCSVAVRLRAKDDHAHDHEAIVAAAREASARTIVVGVPFTMRGTVGPAARSVLVEITELEQVAAREQVTVERWDERLTTVIAERGL